MSNEAGAEITQQRIAALRCVAEKAVANGTHVLDVPAVEMIELADLSAWAMREQEKARERLLRYREKKGIGKAKTPQRGRKAAKKAPVVESADTVEAMTEKLEALKRERAPVKSEALAPNIPANIPASDPLEPVFREKVVAKFPKPQESALPASFKSVLFSRVKTPAQIQHNPAATQFKTAKPKKP
jgi:hypothetical protein